MQIMGENTGVQSSGFHRGWWALAVVALVSIYWDGLFDLVAQWRREEYSYAYLIAPLSAWLVWQRRDDIARHGTRGCWGGLVIIAAGLLLALLDRPATSYRLAFYAPLITIFGLAVAQIGWRGVRIIAAPLGYLLFMVPLPPLLYDHLSANMQLVSARFGVATLRTLGVDVYLEDSLIDLGAYQIQVAEACDGLRYLFPLLSFAYLIAFLYRGGLAEKLAIFVSAAPLTIVVNGGRLAIMGLLVRYLTVTAAEGFLHFFQGWIIFVFGFALLFGEVLLLARLTGHREPLRGMLRFELLQPTLRKSRSVSATSARRPPAQRRALPVSMLAAILLLSAMAVGMNILPTRAAVEPGGVASGQHSAVDR